MSGPGAAPILAAFLVFCRIGACLLVIPGFSSQRIGVQARLFIAVAVALSLTPILQDALLPLVTRGTPLDLARFIASESLKGVFIGLLGRFFFIALESVGMAIAMSVGLTANLGAPVDEEEPVPALVTLITLGATTLLFLTDQHWEVFKGLAASYDVMPAQEAFLPRVTLVQLTESAGRTFMIALRIGSPFLIFSIISNVALGIVNKLVPQVQVSFLASPFLIIGGFFIAYVTLKPSLALFSVAFGNWAAGN